MLELKSIHPNRKVQRHIVDDLYWTTKTHILNMEKEKWVQHDNNLGVKTLNS